MKYQLTCPKCKHEFAYDNGHIDSEIARLGQKASELQRQLSEYKTLPYIERKRKKEWRTRAAAALSSTNQQLAKLKAFRKNADQQVDKVRYALLKDLIKEEFGEEAFARLWEKSEREMEAYQISGLMRHEYTRANSKANVTSVNKL